jgi:6,7-dimethyl-8-ribityllumazine synthase
MMKTDKKTADSRRLKGDVLIVEARFYDDLADELAKGAIAALEAAGVNWARIAVPGALEIPGAIAIAEEELEFDAYVALGTVIRGETGHYDIVAGESARALMDLTLQGLAIGNGILTVETMEQAWARARVSDMNKGAGAAEAALALLAHRRAFRKAKKK